MNAGNNNWRKMNLLDIHLPICSMESLRDILAANDLKFVIPLDEHISFEDLAFNCWGYVAFNYKWEPVARWLSAGAMKFYLETYTFPVNEEHTRAGDIAVFRYGDYLLHTALMTHDPDIVCHKPGGGELCLDTMRHAMEMYSSQVQYVRVKENENAQV